MKKGIQGNAVNIECRMLKGRAHEARGRNYCLILVSTM
jgi:hypothetical protein